MRFDHAIIAVTDLDEATRDFTELGFNVRFGGEHSGGLTHNSLITFTDGSYIELVAPTDAKLLTNPPPPGPGNYLFLFEQGEGYAGFVFYSDDLDSVVERARANGISINDPSSGGRLREDGVELAWRTAFPTDSTFPFVMTDETPRELRVPTTSEFASHPNGSTGIVRTISVVGALEDGVKRYSSLLGIEPEITTWAEGVEAASYKVGDMEAIVAAPDDPESAIARHLRAKGDSLYQIEIASSGEKTAEMHGARIVFR